MTDEASVNAGKMPVVDPATSFKETDVAEEEWQRFFAREAADRRSLAEHLYHSSRGAPQYDFRVLRRWPLLRLKDGRLCCLDIGFLADRMSEGVFWTIHDRLAPEERGPFHQAWGIAFESYAVGVFGQMYPPTSGIFMRSPLKFDRNEIADGILWDGSTLVLVECKGSYLSAEAKYTGSRTALCKELGDKFIEKGVEQLAKGTRWTCSPEGVRRLRELGIDPDALRLVIPVLLVLDRTLGAPVVGEYLNNQLRRKTRGVNNPRKFDLGPLILLTVEDLEEIEANREPLGIFEMLRQKATEDPEQGIPFHEFARRTFWAGGVRSNERIRTTFQRMSDEIMTVLVGTKIGG